MSLNIRVHVSMFIDAPAAKIYEAFVEPAVLTRFWLSSASAALQIGKSVEWRFMVEGAVDQVTAEQLEPGKLVAWRWSDGSKVRVELEGFATGTAVTVIHDNIGGTDAERIDAVTNGTEGFAIVLCDLKTLLETGKSAGLVKSKARLIEARAGH